MTKIRSKIPAVTGFADESLRAECIAKIRSMNAKELELLLSFADQVVACFDPDAVEDFLSWRTDPQIGSLLQLAAALDEERREQLLFAAEDYYVSDSTRH